jgi:NADPH:quinone reductase-like Zn-dependent oxidoreductase
LRQLIDVFNRGLVKPVIDSRFAMSDIRNAFDRLEGGGHFGKVSVVV